jgi:hypothetical protein
VAAGLLVLPFGQPGSAAADDTATCWEYTTTMRLVVIDIDQEPVPGATFDIEHPVCVNGAGAPGGVTRVTTDATGNAFFAFPYVEVTYPVRDLDWDVNASYVRHTSPAAEAHWNSLGYHPASYHWHILRWHNAYGDDGNVSEYLFVWMRTGDFLGPDGEVLEDRPDEITVPTEVPAAPPSGPSPAPLAAVDTSVPEDPPSGSGTNSGQPAGADPTLPEGASPGRGSLASTLKVTESVVASSPESQVSTTDTPTTAPDTQPAPIASQPVAAPAAAPENRSSVPRFATVVASALAVGWLIRRRR